jgi:hypothetical protein
MPVALDIKAFAGILDFAEGNKFSRKTGNFQVHFLSVFNQISISNIFLKLRINVS